MIDDKILLMVRNDSDFFLLQDLPLAIAARDAGYRVHVAAPPAQSVSRILQEKFCFHPTPLNRGATRPQEELKYLRNLRSLYRTIQPDIVHHFTIKPVIYGGLVARVTNMPAVVNLIPGLGYVFTTHSLKARTLRFLVSKLYSIALRHPHSRTLFLNPDDFGLFVTRGFVREQDSVLVPGAGVSMTRFLPTPEPPPPPIAMFVGRLILDKGIMEFVEAARIVRSHRRDVRFVVVGQLDPNPTSVTAAQVSEWQEAELIEWWGPRRDMPEVYSQATIVCLPSYREGLPLVLVEAAASARAMVATDVPGCREVVQHGVNGLLVQPRDTAMLASAILELLNDPEKRTRMAARGPETVAARYSVECVVSTILAVYEELLG